MKVFPEKMETMEKADMKGLLSPFLLPFLVPENVL